MAGPIGVVSNTAPKHSTSGELLRREGTRPIHLDEQSLKFVKLSLQKGDPQAARDHAIVINDEAHRRLANILIIRAERLANQQLL